MSIFLYRGVIIDINNPEHVKILKALPRKKDDDDDDDYWLLTGCIDYDPIYPGLSCRDFKHDSDIGENMKLLHSEDKFPGERLTAIGIKPWNERSDKEKKDISEKRVL